MNAMLARMAFVLAVLAAAAAAGGFVVYRHMKIDLQHERMEFAAFKGGVKALGDAAKERADAQVAADKDRQEKANAENVKTKSDLAGLYAAYASLRDQRARAGGSLLPAASAGTAGVERPSFDRAALDRGLEAADGVLQSGAEKILRRGDAAIADLNTAKRWAQ